MTKNMLKKYETLAKGGVGTIITGFTLVDEKKKVYFYIVNRILKLMILRMRFLEEDEFFRNAKMASILIIENRRHFLCNAICSTTYEDEAKGQ